MTQHKLLITPKVKVGELLDTYPELEDILMEMSPAFKKLKNPILRRTVGKIATLQQAATVGNVPLNKIINALRAKVGQENLDDLNDAEQLTQTNPVWLLESNIAKTFDATPVINAGENPMEKVLLEIKEVEQGKIFLLITPFEPAPIKDVLKKQGYDSFTLQKGEEVFYNYICKV